MTVKGKAKTPQTRGQTPQAKGQTPQTRGQTPRKIQKTPQSAAPKGKEVVMSNGKKNLGTPSAAKTKEIVPKKLATPKSAQKAQKTPVGRKTPQKAVKRSAPAGDAESDDDDDDDFLTGEDEMDDSEDENAPPPAKKAATPKQATPASKRQTPAAKEHKTPSQNTPSQKNLKKTPAGKQTPAGKDGKKPDQKSPAKSQKSPRVKPGDVSTLDLAAEVQKDEDRREQRSKRMVFVKNIPADVHADAVKALSGDIVDVRLKPVYRHGVRTQSFAFLLFKSEAIAKKNFKKLAGSKLGDQELIVDLVGANSVNKKNTASIKPDELDPLKLYVTGFGGDVTVDDLRPLFPKCVDVFLPARKDKSLVGYAFVEFTDHTATKVAHDAVQGKSLKSQPLTVTFAKRKKEVRKAKKRKAKNKKQDQTAAKKAKQDPKEKKETKTKKAAKVDKKKKVEPEEEDDDDDDDLNDIEFDSDDDDLDVDDFLDDEAIESDGEGDSDDDDGSGDDDE